MKTSVFRWSAVMATLLFCGEADAQSVVSDRDTSNFPYWIQMMNDPAANYFTTVRAFEQYWRNRPVTRGSGWKVFKRWEYITKNRIAPDGTRRLQEKTMAGWQSYVRQNRSLFGDWQSLGPADIPAPGPAGYEGLGRLNVIAFDPINENLIYAGAPSGGFWLSDDNGLSWITTTDQLPTIGISAIAVDYSNPARILIGTGDRDHGDAPGMGVFRSTDGGYSWQQWAAGMGNVTVCKLVQHPTDPLVYLAATSGGIFRSVDGGSSWSLTKAGFFRDICLNPGNPAVVYAESDADFYRSANNGLSFTKITAGLSAGQRGAIAVSPASPDMVFFLQSDNTSGFKGLYRSVDGGLTFTTRSESPNILDWSCDGSGSGGQGWYDLSIAVDPADADVVYVGGVNVWKSVDGGAGWSINGHWYGGCSVPAVHADCHFLGFSPVNGRLYNGNDGGIYYTTDGGTQWTDCTVGMTIGQIYKLGQSRLDPLKTINGLQDNGTYTNLSSGWVATGGGDGMECAFDHSNDSYSYHTLYFGSIFRKYNNSGETQIAGDGVNGIDESGDWVTPFILSETDPKIMFVGYANVWRCDDVTAPTPVWSKISTDASGNCSVLEQSPANTSLMYVVRWGNVARTENCFDANPVWTSCSLPGGYTPSDLEAHPTDPDVVYATAGAWVYKSTDKGTTWALVSGTLPDVPINTIVYDVNSVEGLYIGTQTGVLYKNPDVEDWMVFSAGLPVVDVRELEIYYDALNPQNNRLMAATFGRGLWKSDLIETGPLNPLSFSASAVSDVQIDLSWIRNPSDNPVMVAVSDSPVIGQPVAGVAYANGDLLPGGGTVLYSGSLTSFIHAGLSPATNYYYRAWSCDEVNEYSTGFSAHATTHAAPVAQFVAGKLTPEIDETVTFLDQSVHVPTSWSWSFNPSSVNFTDGTNGSSRNPKVQFQEAGAYEVTLEVSNGYGDGSVVKSAYINVTPTPYCLPECIYGTGWGDYISLVQLEEIDNESGGAPNPEYTFFEYLVASLMAGSSYTLTASPGTEGQSHISAWIDYNRDGLFDAGEKLGYFSGSPMPATGTIGFTVPAGCLPGSARLRVREVYDIPDFESCSVEYYGETEDYNVYIEGPARVLSVTLLPEGLFNGTGLNKAQSATGDMFPGTVADQVMIELHQAAFPHDLAAGPVVVDIHQDGTSSTGFSSTFGESYYIVVKHRNSVETWSAVPVSFGGGSVSYNFTDFAGRAFGDNLKLVAGKYLIYTGDVNQDGVVDGLDLVTVDNKAAQVAFGYVVEDVNGDGVVNSGDVMYVCDNAAGFVKKMIP